jgi:hypothetical protein
MRLNLVFSAAIPVPGEINSSATHCNKYIQTTVDKMADEKLLD